MVSPGGGCGSLSSRTSPGSSRFSLAAWKPRAFRSTTPGTAPRPAARAAARYDLVLLDLLLPGSTGSSVLRELQPHRPDAPGRDRLGPLRPADEAARLRARRERLPQQAVLARRARRTHPGAAAPHAAKRDEATCSAPARSSLDLARREARLGTSSRSSPTASFGSCTISSSTRARSSAASASCRRSGATTSIPARTSSTSASAGCARSSATDAPIETVRHAGYRLTAA